MLNKLARIDQRLSRPRVAWLLLAIVEASLLIGLWPIITSGLALRTDFVNFYVAGKIVNQGNRVNLYNVTTQAPMIVSILGHNNFDYFLHPPFFALVLEPFAYLPYQDAFFAWTLLNVGLLGTMPFLLRECVEVVALRPYLGILGMIFYPALTALTLGQSSIVFAFILLLSYLFLAKGRAGIAGLVLSLAAIKFQYVVLIAGFLLANRRYRAVAGFLSGAAILSAISIWIVGVRGLADYVCLLKSYNAHRGYEAHQLALMVNWRGFFGNIAISDRTALFSTIASVVMIGVGLLLAARSRSAKPLDVALALFVTIALLASPYTHFQDLTALLLPLYLTVNAAKTGQIKAWRRNASLWICALIFVLPIVLVILGGHSWQNSRIYLTFPAVLSLAAILGWELYCQRSIQNT